MKNYIIRYGLAGGILSLVLGLLNWFLIAKTYGSGPSQAIGYLSITLSLLCVPLGIKYFKDKLNKGAVSFAQAFKIGTGITLVTSIIMFLYGMLFFYFAGEDFTKWQEAGMTTAQLEQAEAMPAFTKSILFQGLIMFLMVFLIGMIINIVSALILKGNARAIIAKPN